MSPDDNGENLEEGWILVEDAWEETALLFATADARTATHNEHAQQRSNTIEIDLSFPSPQKSTSPRSTLRSSSKRPTASDRSKTGTSKNLKTLQLQQDRGALGKRGETGTVAWDSGVLAARLFANFAEVKDGERWLDVRGKRVVELGTGTGITSLSMLASGASAVLATDQLSVISLAERNFKLNLSSLEGALGKDLSASPSTRLGFAELVWGRQGDVQQCLGHLRTLGLPAEALNNDDGPRYPDLVVATDCVYNDSVVPAFVDTLAELCGPSGAARSVAQSRTGLSDPAPPWELAQDDPVSVVSLVLIVQELRADAVHACFLERLLEKGFRVWRTPADWLRRAAGGRTRCVAYVAWREAG
ncbi:hypothetical protein HDU96_007066 [Phlyctochytrium bullatum]|nr:hypothetical protein HDU96_007066 [Phlyctochytrium bullatum]